MLSLILGSSSPARKLLLERLKVPFEVYKPDADETILPNESPIQLVTRLAETKAKITAKNFPRALIISSDQVITLGNEIFGKPLDKKTAFQQLKKCSGKQIVSYTGMCLLNSETQHCQIVVEPFKVEFRVLTDDMINNYIREDNPLHCAGSIKAENLGVTLFERLCGDDPSALLGLPLIRLVRMLENEGIKLI